MDRYYHLICIEGFIRKVTGEEMSMYLESNNILRDPGEPFDLPFQKPIVDWFLSHGQTGKLEYYTAWYERLLETQSARLEVREEVPLVLVEQRLSYAVRISGLLELSSWRFFS